MANVVQRPLDSCDISDPAGVGDYAIVRPCRFGRDEFPPVCPW
jgi:hypothetical protein